MQFGKNLPQFSVGTSAKCILIRGSVIEKNILLQSPPKIFQLNDIENLLSPKKVRVPSIYRYNDLCTMTCSLVCIRISRPQKKRVQIVIFIEPYKKGQNSALVSVTLIVPMSQCLETWQVPHISLPT